MSCQHRKGRDQHPRPASGGEQSEARFGQRGPNRSVPAGCALPPAEPDSTHDHHAGHHEEDGQGTRRSSGPIGEMADPVRCQGGLREQERHADCGKDHLARNALEDDGADPPADVPCALPMPHTTVYVAEDATGQRRVQEQSTVVVGDGPTQRQPYAQPFRHQAPTPRTAHGGEHAETESGQECGAVDPAHAVQDDGGALPPQQPRDDGRSGEHAETGPHDPRRHEDPPVGPGRASTSL